MDERNGRNKLKGIKLKIIWLVTLESGQQDALCAPAYAVWGLNWDGYRSLLIHLLRRTRLEELWRPGWAIFEDWRRILMQSSMVSGINRLSKYQGIEEL